MIEATSLEFVLSDEEIEKILDTRGMARRNSIKFGVICISAVVLIAAGVAQMHILAIVGAVFLFFGLLGLLAMRQIPKAGAATAARLAGPAKLVISEQGIAYTGANLAEQFAWSRVNFVADRPTAWVINIRPSGSFIIPKGAVPPADAQNLRNLLKGAAGRRYKVRKR